MSIKTGRRILGMVPCVLLLVFWFIYSYGTANEDTGIGIFVSTIVSDFNDSVDFLSSKNTKTSYLESVAIVEEEDPDVTAEKEATKVKLMNAKNGVADLSNWTLPIVGNYTITTYYGSSHTGIDYYSYSGYDSDIKAANNGTVYAVNTGCVAGNTSCNGGRGNYMIINHNNGNYYTLYMHLHNVYVNVGDVVSAGDVIASMGNTGYVIPTPTTYNPYGGTHLHFEVYIGIPDRGGYTISPLSLY